MASELAILLGALKDLAIAAAAVVTAVVAVLGLRKWSDELRGKANFEVARGLARATYKVREELAACRSPLIRGAEYPHNYQPSPPNMAKDHAAAANALGHVYNERWKHVTAALREFDAQTLEAEALWGPEIRQCADGLQKCATTVFVAIESILDNERAAGTHFESDKEFGRRTRAQAHASPTATDNQLSNEIFAAIAAIESKLRGHLTRPT